MSKTVYFVATLALSLLVWRAAPAAAQDPAYVQPGFQKNHDYFSLLPFESIDLGTGSVILTFTDLVIPGNAGREWRFQRTYNNKDRSWTYGLGNMVMSVLDMWPPPAVLPGEFRFRPVLHGADGSRHDTNILTSNQSCPVLADCQWVVTDRFWWYDRDTRKLYLPDGLINSYDTQGRLIDSTDPFGNSVSIAWSASSGGTAVVTIHLGNGKDQVVTLTLRINSQVGYNAISYEPESMTFREREWVYTNPVALTAVRPPLVQEPDVFARGWTYAYTDTPLSQSVLHEIRVTTPQGGQVRYVSELKSYPPAIPGGPTTDTNNLIERTMTGPSIPANSTWTFHYDVSRASWGTNSGARRIDSPSGIQSWYQYGLGLDAGYTRREVDFNGAIPESELRTFEKRATIGYSPLGVIADKYVLTRADITRDSRTYRTDYTYDGPYSNYHRPNQLVEKGNVYSVNSVENWETSRTTVLGYDYGFNLTPNVNSQRYFNGKVGVEEVTLQDETLRRSWGFDHTTGFLNELIEYDIHTGFEPDAFGNVVKVKPGQMVSKQTTYTYEWGVLKNTVTPQYTVSRTINPEGTVASETRGGRTTTFTYDNAFRPTQTQPPGSTNPATTTYNNIDGSTVVIQRGSSAVTTTLDGLGRPIATVNSEGVKTRTGYDADERLIYESYPYKDNADIGTGITYDAIGRVKRRTNPDNTYIEYTYGAGTIATRAANARVTTDTWQAFGNPDERRVVTVTDPANLNWSYRYNAHGDLTNVTAPDGLERNWTYDNTTQRLTSETHPESGTVVYSTFDSAGVPRYKTDARGTVFDVTYDNNYRVVTVTADPLTDPNVVTSTTYDTGTDNRASVAVGNVATSFTYDSAGRLATRTDVISGRSYQRVFAYDTNDRLTALTYPSGRQVTYQYDTTNRITKVTDATAGRDIATTFSYHPSGAPTSFISGNGIVNAVGYDSLRYWPRTLSAGPLSLTYDDHDGAGNIGRIDDSRAGMNQTFGYDAIDRLTSAAGSYGSLTYAYNAHGNRQTAGGVTYTYHPTTMRLLSQGSTSFGYDNSGNTTSAGSSTFTYTTDQQLETATVGGVATTYGYDGDGWRATTSRAGAVSDYLRGPDGQLLSEVQRPGTSLVVVRDYIYAGAQLLAVTGGATSSITFTDATLQAGVTDVKGVHLTELRSAVDSYRVAAGLGAAAWTDGSLSGTPIKAIHIQELRARLDEARAALGYAPASYTDPGLTAGTTPIRAVHLTELRALVQQPGTDGALRYYHTDAIGSVRMTTDQSGNVVARFDDQPFGEPVAASGEPRRFTGAERDADTGFAYLGARYLSSTSGRFTRPDDPGFGNPFDPQSMNLYSYAYNNPLRYVDPTGHAAVGVLDPLFLDAAGFTIWLGFTDAAVQVADAVTRFVTAPRDPGCMANWIGAGAARGLAVGTALGVAAGGVGIIVTAPGTVAINVAGGAAVGSVACMASSRSGGGGGASSGSSGFWNRLKPFRGKTKTNGQNGGARRFYERDHTHGDIEVYDARGRHLGSADSVTGTMTKPAVPGRRIVI